MFPENRSEEQEQLLQAAAKVYAAIFPPAAERAVARVAEQLNEAEAAELVEIGKINPTHKSDRLVATKQLLARAYDRRRKETEAQNKPSDMEADVVEVANAAAPDDPTVLDGTQA